MIQSRPRLRLTRRNVLLSSLSLVAAASSMPGGAFGAADDDPAGDQAAVSGKTSPLRGMLVTGGCCHDYDAQKLIITEGLTKRLGAIDWTIHQYDQNKDTRATVYEDPDWADGFDFVVHNECFGDMKDPKLIGNIVAGHHKSGAAAVMVHCSMHSYRNSDAADQWRELLGVTSTFHERAKRSLPVVPTAAGRDSGLVEALGDGWKTPNGELYVIKRVWPGTTVLATAYSEEVEADQPVIWRREKDGVRVFGTTLGHHNETMRSDTWQAVVAAGTRWAVGRD